MSAGWRVQVEVLEQGPEDAGGQRLAARRGWTCGVCHLGQLSWYRT